jgi:hypothetical protein
VSNFIGELLFVCLRDLEVLTIDATQVAVAEENVSGAVLTNQRRLFSEVRSVGRNNWQPA